MLLKRLGRQPQLQRFVQEIKNVADQGAILTRQLMAIGRKQPLQPQVVDVRSIIGNLIPILQRLLGEDIALSTTVDPALGCVNADPGQLEQVVLNLAVNARDAMPQGGQLSIEAANVELDAASACDLGGLAPGPYIRLRVRDTGCGMGADVLAHIFEPFFTTKEPGKGTGLGLFTAYGIVSQNGGRMTVDSAPGLGTTFTIYLPRIDQVIAAAPSDRAPELAGCGGETILLVEDEAVVRELVRQILQGAGYAVLEAADGEAALQLCERHAGPLHLLLVDVVLPGMSGPEVAKRLVSLRPQLQVLYMSGYTPDVVARYGAPEGQHAYVQKPFTPEMLQRLVRERLAAQRTA
jgi:two-component system cell cycle sensor histidine kinase/response regulator CckA